MDWKAYVLAPLRAGWDKLVAWVKASGNYVYDPPPHHIKYWMVVVLGIAVGGSIFGGAIVSWFDRHVLWPEAATPLPAKRVQPVYLIPKLPDVITTIPPAATIKATEAAPKKIVKRKRKPKCDAVFC